MDSDHGEAGSGRVPAAHPAPADPILADAFPARAAAIDIGSNAIRFQAAEFLSSSHYVMLEQVRTPVRLGHDVFLTGRLTEGAVQGAVQALTSYRQRLASLGITRVRAVATSAVRDADNGGELVARARQEADIEIEVITGAEEVRLVHLAVCNRMQLGGERWILADLGGGSVEVSLVDGDQVHWSVSHGMGSVRLLEELTVAGEEPGRFRRRLEEYAATLRIPAARRTRRAGFIATGGNIEALARLAGVSPDHAGISVLPLDELRSSIELLAQTSYRNRIDRLGLREDRADVILPAALVYEQLCRQAGMQAIHVPHVGLKDGIVLDLVDDWVRHEPHVERQEAIVLAGAVALGRRFRFDAAHGRHVASLALSLFEQLQDLHGLPREARRVLIAGAVLHDVGTFIGYPRHHKHSLYIISQSEPPGLTRSEILMAANVARYHRKTEPAPQHESFMQLSEKERNRVTRLAALLRLADALDREHLQTVREVTARVKKNEVALEITGNGDLLLERWAVRKKAGMFERVYGRTLRMDDPD